MRLLRGVAISSRVAATDKCLTRRLDAPVLSPFRVAAILVPLAFVIGKAILAYKRKVIVVSNTFDLVIGLAGIL